jgi:hypothetical protein
MSLFRFIARLLPVLALALTGCTVLKQTASLPGKAVAAVVPHGEPSAPDPADLQLDVQRFADEYSSRTAVALDDYAKRVGTPEARSQALNWKVAAGSAAVGIASGPNPRVSLLDFLSMTTMTRTALEETWIKTANGAAFQPWLEVSRALETEAWALTEELLTPEQREAIRIAIRQWWASNPGVRMGFFVRPGEFSLRVRQSGEKSGWPGSILGLVGLDPMAGIDPAVREVARTRLFAERALYMAQRMPFLVRWQSELLADELLRGDRLAAALDSVDRTSRAAESASQTAAQLPDRITAERQAILAALEAQQGKLRALSVEAGRTLAAGEKMSASLNTTLITFDALMKRFGVGEPDDAPPDPDKPPFNILDYERTAERIATMARELDALIKDTDSTLGSPTLDKRIADLSKLSARIRADAKSILYHAFALAAGLILLTLASAIVYRRLARPATTGGAG